MATRRTVFFAYLAGAVVVLLTVAFTLPFLRDKPTKLMRYRNAPSFELMDQNGRTFSSSSLKGRIWLVSFIYTRCKGPCPLIVSQLQGLQAEAFKNPDVRFLSISLDPEHDTADVLKAYANQHQAVEGRWILLTGQKDAVRNLAAVGFSVSALDQPDPINPIVHSTKFILVDKEGVIRAFFDGGHVGNNQEILAAIRQLQGE